MRVIEKMQLIETVAIELQQIYTFSDIGVFLAEFDVRIIDPDGYGSKRVYAKDCLKGIETNELKRIASELEVDIVNIVKTPPKNWKESTAIKAFISHAALQKENAKKLRNVLKLYNIDCFVAHEDIKPSLEWQEEIIKALDTMDFFISLHTKGFAERHWCQQEVGYATARKVLMIPIRFDEDPEGFISKIQAISRGRKTAEKVADEVLTILKDTEKTKDLYEEKILTHIDLDDEIPF